MKAKSKNPPNERISNECIIKDPNPDDIRSNHFLSVADEKALWDTVIYAALVDKFFPAAKFALEYHQPPKPKDRLLKIDFGKVDTIQDLDNALSKLISKMSNGEITYTEANGHNEVLKSKREIILQRDLIDRVEKIEEANKKINE